MRANQAVAGLCYWGRWEPPRPGRANQRSHSIRTQTLGASLSRMASRNLARKSIFLVYHLDIFFLFYLVEIDPGVVEHIFSEAPLKVFGEARREQNLEKSISAKADASQLFATDFAARRRTRVKVSRFQV